MAIDPAGLLKDQFGIPPLGEKTCKYRGFTGCLGDACPEYRKIDLDGYENNQPIRLVHSVCSDDAVMVQAQLLAMGMEALRKDLRMIQLASATPRVVVPPGLNLKQ